MSIMYIYIYKYVFIYCWYYTTRSYTCFSFFFFYFYNRYYYTSKVLWSYDVLIVFILYAQNIPSKHFHTHKSFIFYRVISREFRGLVFLSVYKSNTTGFFVKRKYNCSRGKRKKKRRLPDQLSIHTQYIDVSFQKNFPSVFWNSIQMISMATGRTKETTVQ